MEGKMKLTQSAILGERKGKSKMIYFKPDIEERAMELCKRDNMSMSMLVRIALDELLKRRGF